MNRKGFTLIELVMVLVLIGIIAVFLSPRMVNVTSMKGGAFVDKLRADVRYAQDLAMTRNVRSRVYFNGTGTAPVAGYAVASSSTPTCTAFSAATDPALYGSLTVTLNTGNYAGITVTPSVNCLEYDSLGQPYDCTGLGVGPPCSTAPSGMTVTINANAVSAGTVTITPQTGAVN